MAKRLDIVYDSDLIESISSEFNLRIPNKEALRKLIFTLDGEYDPVVPQILNLATGVGKTYLMAAFVEYLRRQGIENVVIITPGKVVQDKTVRNFTPGSKGYIQGAQVPPDIVTPDNYTAWINRQNGEAQLSYGIESPVLAFVFNVQQLIAPRSAEGDTLGSGIDAQRRRPRRFDENAGILFDYLKNLDNLVVIADESHLYSTSAVAFNSAIHELDPAAIVGLTASVQKEDNVIYRYPLYEAIHDKYVKAPVLAFRKGGYEAGEASEEQQLRDALRLRDFKQSYYDAYVKAHGLSHLNAVAFIVCSDVAHATEVADLLTSQEYLGSALKVLQVDNEHDDEIARRRLEMLDSPESEVLAVVSVNKLKEGWDVKNIAVVVTLRAMASEVLTQQTMGRGLRLPFGCYTDCQQIDQLDIIAHQSFKELLEAENILIQFGLDDAISEQEEEKFAYEIKTLANGNGIGLYESKGESPKGDAASSNTIEDNNGNVDLGHAEAKTTVGLREIDDNPIPQSWFEKPEVVTIDPCPRFADVVYYFPVSIYNEVRPPIDLSEIGESDIRAAAERVTSSGDVLYRKEIIVTLKKELKVHDVESAEVDSLPICEGEAEKTLIKVVSDLQLVPKDKNLQYIRKMLVPLFMKYVPPKSWTVKSLSSAVELLRDLVNSYIETTLRRSSVSPSIHPKLIKPKAYSLGIGEKVYEPIDAQDQFVRNRAYGGWSKSLYEAESFDSYSGEYALAKLLDTSPNIEWWNRLHPFTNAYIYYNAKDRYYPDFVARDTDGVYWIIEGKDMRGRDDHRVQEKRKAAESLVRKIAAEDSYDSQYWGYLIAYEDDIAASDTWGDLKALAHPVSNAI